METKEQVKQEVKQYEYAHLVCACGKCGSKYVLQKDVKNGLQINLPTASNAEIVLICKECKNNMALFYIESDGSSLPKEHNHEIESAEIVEIPDKEPEQEYSIISDQVGVESKMEVVE